MKVAHLSRYITRFYSLLTASLFLGAVWVPLLVTLTGKPHKSSLVEHRPLEAELQLAGLSVDERAAALESFYADQLGFREQIVYYNNYLKMNVFNQSPVDVVITGEDGWLFLRQDLDDYQGTFHFEPEQLNERADALRVRYDWLSERGIGYVYLVGPNKSTIYPEKMSSNYGELSNYTLFDQIMTFLAPVMPFEIIDLRPDLEAAKSQQLLYYESDSHWNFWGGYIGYQALIELLQHNGFSQLQPIVPDEDHLTVWDEASDLPGLIGLGDAYPPRQVVWYEHPPECNKMPYEPLPAFIAYRYTCNKGSLKAVVFHDSFFEIVNPILADNFDEVVTIAAAYDPYVMNVILRDFKPDIVIEETVERNLENSLYFTIPTAEYIRSQQAFEAMPYTYVEANPQSGYDDLRVQSAESDLQADGLSFTVTDPQAKVIQLVDFPAGETVVMRMSITTSEETQFRIFFAPPGQPLTDENAMLLIIPRGSSEIYATLPNQAAVQSIALSFAVPQTYILHEFELRSSHAPPSVHNP